MTGRWFDVLLVSVMVLAAWKIIDIFAWAMQHVYWR